VKELLEEVIHKVRTPAVSIRVGADGTKEFLPLLIQAYREAQKHHLNIPKISDRALEMLDKVMNNIEHEAKAINHYLDELTQRSKECIIS
jgi:hypothetical protein